MKILTLFFLITMQMPDVTPVVLTAGGEQGIATIPHHWYDFHKKRDGVVKIKLHADLRAPIYHVYDLTDPKADFLVVDPSYAHADHFSIKGKKGHRFSWSVAGRP